jgi:putative hydrolase of the HAD superfamily
MTPLALLIDFDGVLRHWPADTQLEAAHGLPSGSLLRTAFEPQRMQAVLTGHIDDSDWRQSIVTDLQAAHPESDALGAVTRWSESAGQIDAAMLALVQQRAAGCLLVLVTNATSRLRADLDRLQLMPHFDHVVNSSEIGAAKPAEAFFHAALGRAGCTAADAVFVDDSAGNVQAATALGLKAHRHTAIESTRQFLLACGAIAG